MTRNGHGWSRDGNVVYVVDQCDGSRTDSR
jgi:hypothetical protein